MIDFPGKIIIIELLDSVLRFVVDIGLNRPALGGTVPNSTTMSRRPALLTVCPAFINHPVLGGTSLIRV